MFGLYIADYFGGSGALYRREYDNMYSVVRL